MGDEISIKVKTLDGQSRDVKVSKNATVMDLKARIEQLTKMPKNRQRIIFQGRVLQDSMKLDSDNGKMDGSAVHVVESAPPSSATSGSGSSSRPSTSSASRTQERLINGETIQSRDFQRRHRHERTSNYRENQVRRQVNRMEEFLNNLNASITALENGTSPEQSQQYLQNNAAESNFPESGAIQVRDLASFVGRLADGIQRFPPRLREIEAFMSADRPLQTRDSEEYARARSLIQNAMDAVRHLSHLTQIFSSLVIPLGDEPPRNLNIINTRPHQTLSNFIIPSLQEAGVTPSNFGPGLIFGPFTAPESMTGATASQVFPDLATAAEESVINDLNAQTTTSAPQPPPRSTTTGSSSRPATARVQDSARRSATNPRPQYRFATSILTHSLRPERPQAAGATNGQNRGDGINASINVQANITPNITIRIEAPNSRTSDQTQTDESNNQVGSEPEVVADNTPGLSREILQQITNSVTRLSETGEALIIENDGPTNGDLGRVVGEAVAQTLSQLSRQTQSQNTSSFSSSHSNIPNGRSTTTATTATRTSSGTSTETTSSSGASSSSTSRNNARDRKRKRKDLLEIFKPDQLKMPIIEYLFGPDWSTRKDKTENGQTDNDHFINQVAEKINELILQDFISIFNGDPASAKMTKVFEIIEKLDFLPRAASSFFANLFTEESPKPDCDIVESNLSLLRHFLRELKNNLSDSTKLGTFVTQFINLWIGLNCDILRGGQTTFERCLKRKMKNSHSIKYLTEFVTWSKSQLTPFAIDGYVMSEKIDVAEQQETETSVPESSLSCSELQSKGSKDDSDTTHITTHANITPTANGGDPETNENGVTPSKRRKIN